MDFIEVSFTKQQLVKPKAYGRLKLVPAKAAPAATKPAKFDELEPVVPKLGKPNSPK